MREKAIPLSTFGFCLAMMAGPGATPVLAQSGSGASPPTPNSQSQITPAMLAPKSYGEILTERALTQKDAAMRSVFPSTPTGAALARVATLAPHGLRQDDVAEANQMAVDLASVRASPAAAMADLQSGLARLPEQYWNERQFLIQVGARLAVPPDQAIDFLVAEMSRPAKISADNPHDLGYLSPVTAADTLLRLVPDPAARDSAFRKAVLAQSDQTARQLLVSRYVLADAERGRALAAELGLSTR